MLRATDGRGFIAAVFCVALAGCHQAAVLPFPSYLEKAQIPEPTGPNAFDDYIAAAESAENVAAKYLKRTNFTPGQQDRIVQLLANPMSKVTAAGAKACAFRFEPAQPFVQRADRSGWRMLGLAYSWRIEQFVKNEQFDEAIRDCLVATRFGFDLTGGDCADASLGFAIVDDARRAMLEAMPDLSIKQLQRLASGLESAMSRSPKLESTLENERLNMLSAVEAIQEGYQKHDFKLFRTELRQEVQPAIKYLESISPNDPKRAEYFDSLAKETETVTEDFIDQSRLNARQRSAYEPTKLDGSRPWRRWSKFFFQAPTGIFAMRDRTIALTRLFALHSLLRADTKTGNSPPRKLERYPVALCTDPYSGAPFIYSPTSTSYEIYSVGSDFRDDGGETDEAFMTPDMTLETRNL